MFLKFLTKKILLIVTIVFLVLFVLSLVLMFAVIPTVINSEIEKNTRLDEDTEQWDRFLKLPFDISFKVYAWNVTNPEEILLGNGYTPKLQEVGPYNYREKRDKTILNMDDEKDTVTYTQLEGDFEFDPETSGKNLSTSDKVIVLHPLYNTIMQMIEQIPLVRILIDSCMDEMFNGEWGMFKVVTIQDLFFDGVKFCHNVTSDLCNTVCVTVKGILKDMNIKNIDYDGGDFRFSYFNYKRSPKFDGIYTVNRGRDDRDSLGNIEKWEEEQGKGNANGTYTNYWGGASSCDKISGTDAVLFPPFMKKDEGYTIFTTDIGRKVEIFYYEGEEGEDEYKGITGMLYGTKNTTLYSSNRDKSKDCYCILKTKGIDGKDTCWLDGIIDMQTVLKSPILLSFPHFLWADEHYANSIIGLEPDEKKHKTFLLAEPYSGSPLKGAKRIQLNMVLRKIPGFSKTNNLTRGYLFPLLWLEEGAELTDDLIDMLNDKLYDKMKAADAGKWTFFSISLIMSILFGTLLILRMFFGI